jgi:cytidyltransferase-like protein
MTVTPRTQKRVEERRPRGVFWGRFNPPHKGHLEMVRRFRRQCGLTVAIGSAEHRDERDNPFSGAERKAMMEAYLQECGMQDVRVVAVKDGPSVSWAIRNLIRTCRPDAVFLPSERSRLVAMVEREVPVVRFRRVGKVSSTRIRDSIAAGRSDWKRLTGRSVVRWISDHDGVTRVRQSYGTRPAAGDRIASSTGPAARPPAGGSTRKANPTRAVRLASGVVRS